MSVPLDDAIALLERSLADLRPERCDGDHERDLVEKYALVERLGAGGKTIAVQQVATTRSWAKAGSFRSIGVWLASVSHSTIGQAIAITNIARRLESLPATEAAVRAGALSSLQAEIVTDAAIADPHSERKLLRSAARDGISGLRNLAARVKAAARPDDGEHERRIRAERSLRNWTDPDGAGRISIRGPVLDTATIMSALERFEREIFDAARNADLREPAEACAFDAMVAMARASAGSADAPTSHSTQPRYAGVIRISYDAWRRGSTQPAEICELAGSGPIPVFEASRLLDDAFLKAVVVNGKEVVLVSHLGRTIPSHLRTAVEEMYEECCVEGCHERRHLEIDHNIPVEAGGPTALWNLSRPCTFHHRYKHRHNLRFAGEGTHKYFTTADGLPPPDPGRGPYQPSTSCCNTESTAESSAATRAGSSRSST